MKEKRTIIQITPDDTVAVAVTRLSAGTRVSIGQLQLTLATDIPAGHKVALCNIECGEKIVKYGYPIGAATEAIPAGSHVHVHNVRTLLSEETEYTYSPIADNSTKRALPAEVPTIMAYRRDNGTIGIRNELWIVPTVGCVNLTAESLAAWADKTLSGERENGSTIDGVYAWKHPYGCSQMGDDHAATRRILADLVHHPNAAGVLVLSLGCENNTVEEFKKELGTYNGHRVRFLVAQQAPDEIGEGRRLLEELAMHAREARRQPTPASDLIIGMKCGGSDGFSGITANALVGKVCDTFTSIGGSAILTEVPEMFGAEQLLMDRCATRELFNKTVRLINGFKTYYTSHNQVVYENPSPGNKAGGITTLEDKSLGCVQKGGHAPIRGVISYGERVSTKGLLLLEGPGNDIVSTTAMTAAGAHLILFTTGRGTPLGAPVPTLKISSNSELARHKKGWIDFDAGRLFSEDPESVLSELMEMIYSIASGTLKTKNEENGYREIAIFKDGVTL